MNSRKDGFPVPIDLLHGDATKVGYERISDVIGKEPKKEIAAETEHTHFPEQDNDDILDFFDFVF